MTGACVPCAGMKRKRASMCLVTFDGASRLSISTKAARIQSFIY